MSPIHWLCGALAAFVYGAFVWGAYAVFVVRGQASVKLQVLKGLALAAAGLNLWGIFRVEVWGLHWVGLGVGCYLLSAGLFFWGAATLRSQPQSLAFSPDLPQFVQRGGPYRWIRHPFYTAYLLSYLAGWVLTQQHWLLLVVAGMTGIYIDAALLEERKFAQSSQAEAYARYRQTTGMFLPRLWPRTPAPDVQQ